MIIIIGPLYSIILQSDEIETYILNLTLGLFVWNFLVNCVLESCEILNESKSIYKLKNIGILNPSLRVMFRNLITSFHQLLAVTIVFFIYGGSLIKLIWIALISPLIAIAILPLMIINSLMCLRFRDLSLLINMVMPILFFVSPIIWTNKFIDSEYAIYLQFNPISYIVNVTRDPILNGTLPINSILILFTIFIVSTIVCIFLLRKIKNKFIMWL